MAMALRERIPVERITAEAREAQFGHTALTLIAGVLYGLGWVVGKAFGLVWLALAWAWTAVKLGFTEARGSTGGS